MDTILGYLVLSCSIWHCQGNNFRKQLADLSEDNAQNDYEETLSRRSLDLRHIGSLMGSPSMPSHLPEAEPILPGHTLIRPALGMLKSAVKFPHRDLENGAGVYGGINNLGIRYDGRNERILYSGFRRTPADYIVVAPISSKSSQPKFAVSSVVLDLDKDKNVYTQLLRNVRKLKKENGINKRILKIYANEKSTLKHPKPTSKKDQLSRELPRAKLFVYKKPSPKRLTQIGLKNYLRQNSYDADLDDEILMEDSNETIPKDLSKSVEDEELKQKKKWFWESQDLFSHIKINPNAPEYNELIPANVSNNIRNWWFYNQDDYKPLEDKTA